MSQGYKCCMRQHGIQCRRIDNRPGESCLWQASWRILCPSRSGFEGVASESSFDRRPYAN
jgi:hypothetical protein